jgi:nicotinamide-nucleotide amidase
MNIELINTGTELILGRVLNSHQQWLCRELANLGFIVNRQVAVADAGVTIQGAVREALSRADLIITTGGLGPTSDDITRDLIADLLGKRLEVDPKTVKCIENFFALRKRRIPENAMKQALVPEGAVVLQNHFGTAPGLIIEIRRRRGDEAHFKKGKSQSLLTSAPTQLLVMLPGPPRELRPMFTGQVAPLIRKTFPQKTQYVCRTLRTTGLGESFVEEKIAAPLVKLVSDGLELGYCARVGEVEVRLSARSRDAKKLVDAGEKIVRKQIAPQIFSANDESLEAVIVRELTKRKKTLALAESCTGGLIAHRITNVSGASAVLMAGLVTYSNEAKERLLGVRQETLKKFGAVSEETAREMAEGARLRNKTDFAIAVTGIAGPTGGTKEKPVGTVFIAHAMPKRTIVERHFNQYDRETFKFLTSQQALDLLRRELQ